MQPPRLRILPILLASAFALPAVAGDSLSQSAAKPAADSNVFTLGEIAVTAQREDASSVGTATVNREQLWDFNKDGLTEALNPDFDTC